MTVRMPTVWAMMLRLVRFFLWAENGLNDFEISKQIKKTTNTDIRITSNVNGADAPSREEFYNV